MLATVLLWINGLGFIGLGLVNMLAPEAMAAVIGYEFANGNGYADFVATYGGVFAALGVPGLLGARAQSWRLSGLMLYGLLYLGLATGRAVGLTMTDGVITAYSWGAWGFELLSVLLIYLALTSERRAAESAAH